MKILRCDLDTKQQTIAMVDTETGEFTEKTISHEGNEVREFYTALEGPVVVGIEATEIGINKCARESGFDRKNFIRKLIRGIPVKRNSYNEFVRWLQSYESENLEWKVKTFQ